MVRAFSGAGQPCARAEKMMNYPLELVAGVDEVGRGPLAGPVVVAAVILDPNDVPSGLADSKKLTAKRRQALAEEIRTRAVSWQLAVVEVAVIDAVNILQATMQAMQQAVLGLSVAPAAVMVDGNRAPKLPYPTQTLVKGDSKHAAISAASIIAKTWRDAHMAELAVKYPGYGWEGNAGYGTKAHLSAIEQLGITPHHRMSFAPMKHGGIRTNDNEKRNN